VTEIVLRPRFDLQATVHCVHDREKRVVTTERDVAELGLRVGQVYDARIHRLMLCACCDNLFVDVTGHPRYCSVCLGRQVHVLGGPLPEPRGEV